MFEGLLAPAHLLVVGLVALLVLGPDRLPAVARQAGRGLRTLEQLREQVVGEFHSLVPMESDDAPTPPQSQSPPTPIGPSAPAASAPSRFRAPPRRVDVTPKAPRQPSRYRAPNA